MKPASLSEILDRIQSLAPFLDQTAAERALSTTLGALGAILTSDEISGLASALPVELAQRLCEAQPRSAPPSGLFRGVAEREHLPLGRAIELVQITFHALSDALPQGTLTRLARHLPELATLLEAPEALTPVDVTDNVPQDTHDLAGGRPGAQRSINASSPNVLAHRHSVARSDDPHAETKLSSTPGPAQEREQHTLATGHPGSDRSVSGKP